MTESAGGPAATRAERLRRRYEHVGSGTNDHPAEDQADQGANVGPAEPVTENRKPGTSEAELPPRRPARRGTVLGKEKLQPYVATDLADQARNAWWWTRNERHGYETFSDMLEAALAEKVQQLQAEYHGGTPFESRPDKKLRGGPRPRI